MGDHQQGQYLGVSPQTPPSPGGSLGRENALPKRLEAYRRLQDIKGLASPQSAPVRCSPGKAGLCSAAASGLALDIFPLHENMVMRFKHANTLKRHRFPSELISNSLVSDPNSMMD